MGGETAIRVAIRLTDRVALHAYKRHYRVVGFRASAFSTLRLCARCQLMGPAYADLGFGVYSTFLLPETLNPSTPNLYRAPTI